MSIKTLLDFEQLTVEDVTGRLMAVQDHEGPHTELSAAGGKLLYTMEQWHALDKKKKEEGSGSSGSKEHHWCPRGGKKKGPRG